MFKSIVVPLDGSTLAEAVLPYVRTLTRALHSRATLLHVMDADGETSPRNLIGLMTAAKAEEALVLARRRVKEYLAKLAETMTGIEVRQVVATGCPGKVIAAEADSSDGINLIAMSTHGRSGIGRWIIGSITDKVIHTATSFMLVVRSSREMSQTEGEAPLQRIILPLDGSELSEQAIPTALELSKRLGLEVTLFHVVSTMQLSMAEEWPAGYPDVLKEVEDDAHDYLVAKERELSSQGVDGVEAQTGRGDAAAEIVDLAHRNPGSLVVMTSRGRSGLGRALLGSVADRVVCNSAAPVLLVRT